MIHSARRKYLADITNEVHYNGKRFWFYFSPKNKKRKHIPDKIYFAVNGLNPGVTCNSVV